MTINENAMLSNQVDTLTAERDALTAKVASFESRIDQHVKTELALIVNNKALKDAARLALDAMSDEQYVPRYMNVKEAITALKAVL